MRRLVLVVAVLLVGGAADARAATIEIGPVTVAGWRMTGLAGGSERAFLVGLTRGAREVRDLPIAALGTVHRRAAYGEAHVYGSHGRRITVSRSRIRARLAADGAADLRFRPSGSARYLPPPAGCSGHGERVQPGRVVGHLTVAVGLVSLPTLSLSAAPARRVLRPRTGQCRRGGASRFVEVQTDQPRAGIADFEIDRTARETEVSAHLWRNPGAGHPLLVNHLLLGFLPPSALAVAPDLSSAGFTGSGPFAGTATFTSEHPRKNGASGQLTGPLTANFTGLGPVPALGAAPVSATLARGLG